MMITKHITRLISPVFLIAVSTSIFSQSVHLEEIKSTRQKININANWKFQRDEVPENFASAEFSDASWETVSVPHTMKLESNNIYQIEDDPYHQIFQRYIGWYRKTMTINAEEGQKVFLEFEGAHQVTKCWVNGKFVGEHAIGGYTPFHFDITDFINSDDTKNTIVLSVDNRPNKTTPPDGDMMDYLKFSGLYRDVYLVITNPVYITFPWEDLNSGIFISTPSVTKENATVQIRSTVRNTKNTAVKAKILNRIIDKEGYVIQKTSSEKEITANSDFTFMQATGITEDLHLWSIDDPYLYRVQTLVYENNKLVDLTENPLGVRKFEFRKGLGFLINDEVVELIGANKHQAYPFLGDAVPNTLLRKDAIQFKEAGFNVVRLAHYPHDNAFIEACDELGILILEEAPTWIAMPRGKWFDNLLEANRRMIRNHRNNPSIFMWSGGMNHRGPVEQIHYSCKEEDHTRATGSNGSPWSGPRNSGVADIYTPMDYQNFGIKDIDLSFLCEHGSSKDAYQNQVDVSLSRQSVSRFGVAMWTAHDYFSFKRNWGMVPRRPFSIFRVPNPVMYWYKSELTHEPMVYIADERAGTGNKVHVFSNCDEVALYNNGKLVAKQKPDSDPQRMYCNSPSYTFNLEEEKGDLHAKGYIRNAEVASFDLKQTHTPYQIKLKIEDDNIPFEASSHDMRMVRAYILDKNGNHIISDTSLVSFSIKGEGEIIGDAEIGANPNKAYWGTASAILRSTETPGQITVTASVKGLKSASASIVTVAYNSNRTIAETKPVYDYPIVKIDIGSNEQFEQFTWDVWSETDSTGSTIDLPEIEGAKVSISANNSTIKWTTGWGMSGNIPYMAMDGASISPKGELFLTFSGLPKGKYSLQSYHHLAKELKTVQGTAILYKYPNSYQISVKDNKGSREVVNSIEPTSGGYLDNVYPASVKYTLHSNGTNDIVIAIKNYEQDIDVILNGFILKRRN